jgi:hypothetical protein
MTVDEDIFFTNCTGIDCFAAFGQGSLDSFGE